MLPARNTWKQAPEGDPGDPGDGVGGKAAPSALAQPDRGGAGRRAQAWARVCARVRVRACGGMGGRRNQRPGIYASSQGAPGTDQAFSPFDTRRGGTLGCRAADPIKRWSRGVRPGPRAPSPALLTLPRCLPRNRPAGTKCSGSLQRDPWARPTWKGAPWPRALWAGLQRQDLRTERMGRFSARSWLSWRRLSLSEAVEESSSSSFWEGVAQGEGRGKRGKRRST